MKVEKLVYGGLGLGRIGGRVAMAPFVLPGEQVRLETVRTSSDWVSGRVVELLERSPERIEPRCPYFLRCGGCHYQHSGYPFQVQQKRLILAEVLERVGKLTLDVEIGTVIGPEWEYRNRAQFHLEEGRIGYREPGSHRLCAVDACPILSPRLQESLAVLERLCRDPRWPRFLKSIELFTNETAVQVNVIDSAKALARSFFERLREAGIPLSQGSLDYEVAGVRYRVGFRSFFQVNRFLIDTLVDVALQDARGATALDLYAGVGLFTVPMAQRFGAVTAVEAAAGAVEDLEFNAGRAGIAVTAVRGRAEDYLDLLAEPPEFVLADPPRAGLGPRLVQRLAGLKPGRVVIVSCDPATLARDLAGLLPAGYRIERLTLVDLFPQTFHIETVVHLRRI